MATRTVQRKSAEITEKLFDYDRMIGGVVVGVDEVGRGPLAGPVVCACCAINEYIEGINDSKKLSEKKRESLFEIIKEKALAFSIAIVDEKVIDDINILNATRMCMENAVKNLNVKPDIVLIDAVKDLQIPYAQKDIIKGDATSYAIAAASILAKVTRDRMMVEYDKFYPQYGFAKHKGYGTKMHIDAIKEYGLCDIHRRTFVKNFV